MSTHSGSELLDYEEGDSVSPTPFTEQELTALMYEGLDDPEEPVPSTSGTSGISTSADQVPDEDVQLHPSEGDQLADPDIHMESVEVPISGPSDVAGITPESGNPIDLSPFGTHYIKALGEFLSIHTRFVARGPVTKEIVWSAYVRDRKASHIKKSSEQAFNKLVEAIFLDRNIKVKALATAPLKPESSIPSAATPVASFQCPCEQIHKAISDCKLGMGHVSFCEEHVRKVSSTQVPRQLSYIETEVRDTAQTFPAAPELSILPQRQPQPQFQAVSVREGRLGPRGRGGKGGKRDRSASSSNRGQPSHKQARGRGDFRQSGRGHHNHPSTTTSCTEQLRHTPHTQTADSIPSANQFRQLFSQAGSTDIRDRPLDLQASQARLRAKGLLPPPAATETKAPPPPPTPGQIGEWALLPGGSVDWTRVPRRPDYLPANMTFDVTVVKNRWHVEIKQSKI